MGILLQWRAAWRLKKTLDDRLADCVDLAPAGLCSPEGGDKQAEPHHPQQVGDSMLGRGTVRCQTACCATRPAANVCMQCCMTPYAVPHCNACLCRLRGLPAYVLDYSDLIPPNRCVGRLKMLCRAFSHN